LANADIDQLISMPTPIYHYCQKCLAANPLGQDFCARCGTRLMIVVEPTSSRFEVNDVNLSTDEHLLERISATENRVARLTERLERSLDLVLRQAQNSYFDRSLVKVLIGLLSQDGVIQTDQLEKLWNERCKEEAAEQEESVHLEEIRLSILGRTSGILPAFAELVNEGFLLINQKQVSRGVEKLQRAVELSPGNSSLNLFIGQHFFRSGKTRLARTYLSKAHETSPDDVRIALLLGLTCADDGDVELAKYLLNEATQRGGSSFAGHYGLGRLFVAEKNWRKALSEFKQALNIRPSPEAHYVLACLYYQLDRDPLAIRHLRKAIEMDEAYAEAFHLLALVYRRTGQIARAQGALEKAELRNPSDSAASRQRKRVAGRNSKIVPLFEGSTSRSRRLIMGVDKRLTETLREDALRAFTGYGAASR